MSHGPDERWAHVNDGYRSLDLRTALCAPGERSPNMRVCPGRSDVMMLMYHASVRVAGLARRELTAQLDLPQALRLGVVTSFFLSQCSLRAVQCLGEARANRLPISPC